MSNPDEWFTAEIRVPAGTHLAPSRETSGLNRALLFAQGAKGTVGPPEVRMLPPQADAVPVPASLKVPDLLDPKTIVVASVALAVGVVSTIVVIKHGPKIKAWWTNTALPRVTAGLAWLADVDIEEYINAQSKAAVIGPVPTAEFSTEVASVVQDFREDMSSLEAQRRLLLIFLAASIIAENLRQLGRARISDADFQALQAAMSTLVGNQAMDHLNQILSDNVAVLDEETHAIFADVFKGGEFIDGTYRPLTLNNVEEALQLPEAPPDDDTGDEGVAHPV